MNRKQCIYIRNIVTLIIICNILYFIFPFPPIFWRLGMSAIGIYVFWKDGQKGICTLEKITLFFIIVNLTYYLTSYIWLDDPTETNLGNTFFCMMSLFIFMRLGHHKQITEEYITIAAIIIVFVSIPRYHYDSISLISYFGRKVFTLNISTLFLVSLPMLIIIKNKYISFFLLFICISFIFSSAKRGNVVAMIIPIICIVFYLIKENKNNIFGIVILTIFIIISINYFRQSITENEYILQRIEQTKNGDDSNRGMLYSKSWETWKDSESYSQLFWGHGWDGTVKTIGNRSHNDWLELLVDFGFFGFFVYFLLIVSFICLIVETKAKKNRAILICILYIWLIKSFVSMAYSEEYLAILFIPIGYIISTNDKQIY